MTDDWFPPFEEGDLVTCGDSPVLTVTWSLWWTKVNPDVDPYWYVEASCDNFTFHGNAKQLTMVKTSG